MIEIGDKSNGDIATKLALYWMRRARLAELQAVQLKDDIRDALDAVIAREREAQKRAKRTRA